MDANGTTGIVAIDGYKKEVPIHQAPVTVQGVFDGYQIQRAITEEAQPRAAGKPFNQYYSFHANRLGVNKINRCELVFAVLNGTGQARSEKLQGDPSSRVLVLSSLNAVKGTTREDLLDSIQVIGVAMGECGMQSEKGAISSTSNVTIATHGVVMVPNVLGNCVSGYGVYWDLPTKEEVQNGKGHGIAATGKIVPVLRAYHIPKTFDDIVKSGATDYFNLKNSTSSKTTTNITSSESPELRFVNSMTTLIEASCRGKKSFLENMGYERLEDIKNKSRKTAEVLEYQKVFDKAMKCFYDLHMSKQSRLIGTILENKPNDPKGYVTILLSV